MIEGKLDSNEEGRCFSKLSTFDPGFEGLHTRLVTKDAAEAYLISSQINVFVID